MVSEGVRGGGRFPLNMKPLGQMHNLTFNPENGDHALMVPSPEPGDWFMFAYLNERLYLDYAQKVSTYETARTYAERLIIRIRSLGFVEILSTRYFI